MRIAGAGMQVALVFVIAGEARFPASGQTKSRLSGVEKTGLSALVLRIWWRFPHDWNLRIRGLLSLLVLELRVGLSRFGVLVRAFASLMWSRLMCSGRAEWQRSDRILSLSLRAGMRGF